MLSALALLTQVLAVPVESPADDRPIRLWLGASPVARGTALPVYVAAATEGYLLVLRATTDGHVEVVFPADPNASGVVRPGAYALRGANDRPALVVNEPNGTGMVIAALSPRPFRYAEFLRGGAWSREAMVASWPGADGVGTLTDIVQRMLGDGWFTYDLAIYTVGQRAPRSAPAPSSVAADATPLAPTIGVCVGCTIVYQPAPAQPALEQTIVQEMFVERTILVPFPFPSRHRRAEDKPRFKTEGICQAGVDCPPGTGSPAKSILVPQRASIALSPIRRREAVREEPSPVAGMTMVVSSAASTTRTPEPAPAVVRTGSRFATRRFFTTSSRAPEQRTPVAARAAAPAPAPTSRTIALPRVYRRR